jgi:hypothetical protein
VKARAERATTRTVETREVRGEASRDDAERLALIVPGRDQPVTPTHWSFGQLASLVGAPAGYMPLAVYIEERQRRHDSEANFIAQMPITT